MPRRNPFTNARTIIRFGAAHADIDIRATDRKTGEAKAEAVDLSGVYYMAGREGHIRARREVHTFADAVCSLHGIKRRKKAKAHGKDVVAPARRAVEAVMDMAEAVMVVRTPVHMPMGA